MQEVTLGGLTQAHQLVPTQAPQTAPAAARRARSGNPWAGSALALHAVPDDNDDVPARRHLLRDVADRYMAGYVGHDGNSRTSTLAMWVAFLGDRYIDEITSNDVVRVVEHLRRTPLTKYAGRDSSTGERIYREHGKRAPATLNRYVVVLSALYRFAKSKPENGPRLLPLRHVSPTDAVPKYKVNNVRDRSLDEDQVQTLLAFARTEHWPRMYLFALMLLTTGARKGELLQIRGRNLDLGAEQQTATAHRTKNGEVKVMVLTTAVVREIRRLGVPSPDEYLFPSVRRPGTPFCVEKSFKRLLVRAGLPGSRLHDMRHTVGSTLAREGRSPVEIATVSATRPSKWSSATATSTSRRRQQSCRIRPSQAYASSRPLRRTLENTGLSGPSLFPAYQRRALRMPMASDLNTDHLPQPGERVGLVWDDEESPRDRAGTVLAIVSEPDVQLVCAIVLMDGGVIDCMRLNRSSTKRRASLAFRDKHLT
jgi:integrase